MKKFVALIAAVLALTTLGVLSVTSANATPAPVTARASGQICNKTIPQPGFNAHDLSEAVSYRMVDQRAWAVGFAATPAPCVKLAGVQTSVVVYRWVGSKKIAINRAWGKVDGMETLLSLKRLQVGVVYQFEFELRKGRKRINLSDLDIAKPGTFTAKLNEEGRISEVALG